jgi:hypothetical protein
MNRKIWLSDEDEKNIEKYLEYRNKNLDEDDKPWKIKDVIKVSFTIGMDDMLDKNRLNGNNLVLHDGLLRDEFRERDIDRIKELLQDSEDEIVNLFLIKKQGDDEELEI